MLQLIDDQSSKSTRRSAGLPSIMVGLLAPATSTEFDDMVESLTKIVNVESSIANDQQELRLPQVHALNCLRELMTTARFREQTNSHLSTTIVLAASSLESPVWAIRNCGLMLFRACASRFEPPDYEGELEASSQLEQSHAAIIAALKLIASEENKSADLIFAGLDLISRLVPDEADEATVRASILHHAGNRIWMLREHVARVYSARIPTSQVVEQCVSLLHGLDTVNQNRCHGLLLCVQGILGKLPKAGLHSRSESASSLFHVLDQKMGSLQYAAPAVKFILVEVLRQCANLWPDLDFGMLLARFLDHDNKFDEDDSSDRFPNGPSTQCAGMALLRPSLLSCRLSKVILKDCSLETIVPWFQTIAIKDPDCAATVLQRLNTEISSQSPVPAASFFTALDLGNLPAAVRQAALIGIFKSLDQCLEKDCIFAIPDLVQRLARTAGRDEFNAAMLAAGAILGHVSQRKPAHTIPLYHTWTSMLQSSVENLTDAAARLNAAQSLYIFQIGFIDGAFPLGRQAALRFCSIGYDFTNDDDEEVRSFASEALSYFIPTNLSITQGRFCPLALRRQLVDLLVKDFSASADFHVFGLARILQPDLRFESKQSFFTQLSSAKEQLEKAADIHYDLFEEEKQNLYIDELGEIDLWYSAMSKVHGDYLEENIFECLIRWALDGLEQLRAHLGLFKEANPYGSGWRLDVLIVYIRILRVANLLLVWTEDGEDGIVSQIRDQSTELRASIQPFCLHPRVERVLEELCAT